MSFVPRTKPLSNASGLIRKLTLVLLSATLLAPTLVCAEDWWNIEGNNRATNASEVNIPAGDLRLDWQRRFANLQLSGTTPYSMLNLVTRGPYVSVVAVDDGVDISRVASGRVYLSILDRGTGQTVNTLETFQDIGNIEFTITQATDVPRQHAFQVWDPVSGILYLKQGGDLSFASAYYPLANLDSWQAGTWQPGVAAFADLAPRINWQYSPELHEYLDPREFGNVRPNDGAFIVFDPENPYAFEGSNNGHWQGSNGYNGFNRFTGRATVWSGANDNNRPSFIPASSNITLPVKSVNGTPMPQLANSLFTGMLAHKDRLYGMLYTDEYGDSTSGLGVSGIGGAGLLNTGYRDLGLGLASWQITPTDILNDGHGDERDTAAVVQRFLHNRSGEADVDGLNPATWSWDEVDYGRKNKAFVVDARNDGAWAAWKPGLASGVKLVYADDSATYSYDLGIGGGLAGKYICPVISLSTASNGRTYIAYLLVPEWDAPGTTPILLAVVDVTNPAAATVSYTRTIVTGSQKHALRGDNKYGLPFTNLVVAGDTAYVCYVDNTSQSNKSLLTTQAFDLKTTTSNPSPVTRTLDLGLTRKVGTCIIDVAAVDGQLLFWISENNVSTGSTAYSVRYYQSSAYHLVAMRSNLVPQVTITGPAEGMPIASGASLTLTGAATDIQDGNISGSATWSSNIDGALGSGASITTTLSPGVHTITYTAADAGGLSARATREVVVTGGVTYAVSFAAGSNGSLTGSLSQSVAAFANASAVTAVPVAGYYFSGWTGGYTGQENPLVLSRVDGAKSVTAQFRQLQGAAPVLTVLSPANSTTVTSSKSLNLTATVDDPDLNETASPDLRLDRFVKWSSDRDGEFGQGADIGVDASTLSPGSHVLTASVTDADGWTTTATRTVFVQPVSAPLHVESGGIVSIEAENYSWFSQGIWPGETFYWNELTDAAASGGKAMQGRPVGLSGLVNSNSGNGPTLYYKTRFTTPGTYALHFRLSDAGTFQYVPPSGSGSNLSASNGGTANYVWLTIPTSDFRKITVAAASEVVVGVRLRNDTTKVDKIVLKKDDNTTPTGSGNAESTREAITGVFITNPLDTTTIAQGQAYHIQGMAYHYFNGDDSSALQWSSSKDGALGSGASVSAAGLSIGVHTLTASYSESGQTRTATAILNVAPPAGSPAYIITETLPAVQTGGVYTATLEAIGGSGTKTWTLDSGSLPAGMTLSTSGVLSGTPSAAGFYTFTVKITDGAALSSTKALTLQVYPTVIRETSPNTPDWFYKANVNLTGVSLTGGSSLRLVTNNITASGVTYNIWDNAAVYRPITPQKLEVGDRLVMSFTISAPSAVTNNQVRATRGLGFGFLSPGSTTPPTTNGTFGTAANYNSADLDWGGASTYSLTSAATLGNSQVINGGGNRATGSNNNFLSSGLSWVNTTTNTSISQSWTGDRVTFSIVRRENTAGGQSVYEVQTVLSGGAEGELSYTNTLNPSSTSYVDNTFSYIVIGVTTIPQVNAGSTGGLDFTVDDVNVYYVPVPQAPTAPPTPPTGLSASAVSTSQINLAWTDASADETGFEIERSTSSGSGFTLVTTTAADALSYNDTGLTAFTTYYYRVRAMNGAGNSAYTNESSATTLSPMTAWTDAISWNGADSLPSGDPDGDGINNLLEYSLNLDPLTPDANGFPTSALSIGNQLTLSFKRYADRTDLTYIVEASDDLSTWTTLASSVAGASFVTQNNGQVISEKANGNEVSATIGDDPANASSRRFIRLRVIR